ncbi:phosphonate ABC transporter, periplasmic phosphonate-binding protein [Candidatus Vecturithrix granuli]|uniref:Phosphonate ABC transporter, periplasmic phosphonate-binding protein n=1 Tax=Vecturithrix granuli TaxID=1499967 RepID=A0A081C9I4_VECG1|nr:phosphonate ABC transporter, periplasmic phosphonate-binding protein [Candidatus Vecturithrix granuli]
MGPKKLYQEPDMRSHKLSQRIIMLTIFYVWLLPLFDNNVAAAQALLRLAILPCSDVVISFKKFHPLITYLEQETGFNIQLLVPADFDEFERSMNNGDIDFAFQDPHTYVRLADLYDQNALLQALNREGTTIQAGVVVVRKESGIHSMEDLRGKNVMFGPKLSTTKWLAAKLLFEEHKINIDHDLRTYSNGGCCEDIAFHVYLKTVDAGVVCDHFLETHLNKQQELGFEASQLTIIARTNAVPTRVFAARKALHSDILSKVNRALLLLDNNDPAHAQILQSAEIGGFRASSDADYDDIRALISSIQEE